MKTHSRQDWSSIRTAAILIAIVALLYLARAIFIPLAFAVTLALILSPAVTFLVKRHISRPFAALAVLIISIAAAGAGGFVIFNQFIQVLTELPSYQENIHNKIQAMRAPAKGALRRATESVKEIGKELSTTQAPAVAPPPNNRGIRGSAQPQPVRPLPVEVVPQPVSELQYARDLATPFLAPMAILGLVLIFTLFLLIEQVDIRDRLFRLAGLSRMTIMTQALDDATQRVSRYLTLQFLVNTCFGVLCGIGLSLIGVPYAALWGAFAAILRIVPYVGATIAGLLPLLLSLAVFDNWKAPLLVFILFSTLELVTSNLIEPWLYGTHTGISSLALLLTTAFWATLWGPAGLILSTPLTVCLVVLGRHVPQFSFLHILLGDEPVLGVEAQLYQRLLATDEHGARAVLDQHFAENSVVNLYDSVLIPALTMTEVDRHKGTLDADREEFIFMSVREILGEFAERIRPADAGGTRSALTRKGRIFCLPASDEADEITASMLAQLLEAENCVAISFPSDNRLQLTIRMSEPTESDLFCISALPPFAFARARTLSIHLRRRFPKTKIIVGVWGFAGDTNRAIQRFAPAQPEKLVTSLAMAVEWLAATVGSTSVEPDIRPLAS